MKLRTIAALAVAASAAFADGEDETAATTLAGARVPVSVYGSASANYNIYQSLTAAFTYRKSATFGGDYGGVWVDVGSPRTLTGVAFYPRNVSQGVNIKLRWQNFSVWGADAPGPYSSTAGMELVVTNYLEYSLIDQANYNALTNFSGISAHRYYYFANYDDKFNMKMELWSDDPALDAFAPTATDATAGDYLFTGIVTNLPGGASGEVCVCVAAKDYDVDFAAWQANGRTFVQSGLKKGDSYSIAATGITSGRRYAREFVRVDGGDWFSSNYTWQLGARGEIATPKAYIVTTDSTKDYYIYDGSTSATVADKAPMKSITFALDPTLDYAVLRFYPRTYLNKSGLYFPTNFDCWARLRRVTSIQTSKDEDGWPEAAERVENVTNRELYKVLPTETLPEMTWTDASGALRSLWTIPNGSGSYVDVILDRKAVAGARWLRVGFDDTHNCKEIELYTVKHGGFVFTVR